MSFLDFFPSRLGTLYWIFFLLQSLILVVLFSLLKTDQHSVQFLVTDGFLVHKLLAVDCLKNGRNGSLTRIPSIRAFRNNKHTYTLKFFFFFYFTKVNVQPSSFHEVNWNKNVFFADCNTVKSSYALLLLVFVFFFTITMNKNSTLSLLCLFGLFIYLFVCFLQTGERKSNFIGFTRFMF